MSAHLMTRNLLAARNNRAYLRRAYRKHGNGQVIPFKTANATASRRRLRPVLISNGYILSFSMAGARLTEMHA